MNDTKTNEQGIPPETHVPEQSVQDDLKKLMLKATDATKGFDWKHLFSGRLDPKNYLYGVVGSLAIVALLMLVPFIGIVVSLAFAVLGFCMTVRRLHDINTTGWASLVLLVPFAGILAVIYLCWKMGDTASNQYGPIPDQHREMFHAFLNT